jgi:hypothetical protein
MDISRRRLLFCAPALVLTPGLLMPINPRLVPRRLPLHPYRIGAFHAARGSYWWVDDGEITRFRTQKACNEYLWDNFPVTHPRPSPEQLRMYTESKKVFDAYMRRIAAGDLTASGDAAVAECRARGLIRS